jgi:formamidopyrimidine-DNA glycosylase
MLEIPESTTLAKQLNQTVRGKVIQSAKANTSAHKFAFYFGDPEAYHARLAGQSIGDSHGLGSMVEISAGNKRIVLGDGANLRYFESPDLAPTKHQLYLAFEDGSVLTASVQMYGAVLAFEDGQLDSDYYTVAKQKPFPLTPAFDMDYFVSLVDDAAVKLSAKAFLATHQRIPGLGNGVLQDILFNAKIHPKRKMGTLSKDEYEALFFSIKNTLACMTEQGGRDTEKDLFGNPGGYTTLLSKNTVGKPCPVCDAEIQKCAYMGGAVYWCPGCQGV